jgi:SET domain-containing protein
MLYVKRSTLPKSGKGLFTKRHIPRGKVVCEYQGESIPWSECLKREGAGKGGYFMYVTAKHCIDARPATETLGRYANDAKGFTKVEGLRNNSFYEIRGKKVFIIARKNIPEDSEILVGYGKEYWDTLRDTLKKDKKKASIKKHLRRKSTVSQN